MVEFAQVGLNFDVNTIMHLRPFLAILLQRRSPAPPPVDLVTGPNPSRADERGRGVGGEFSSTRSSSVASLTSADTEQQPQKEGNYPNHYRPVDVY